VRYPAVELAMGVVFAAVTWRVGLDWALPGFLLFAWMLVVVAVIDARTRRIPNRLTYPLTPALIVLLVLAALVNGSPGAALRVVLGALAAFGFLLLLALISPRGMGMGDVKLAAFIGAGLGYVGWGAVVVGIFVSFLLGGLVAVLLVTTRLRRRKEHIPFGPYLAVGALVALLFGEQLARGYLAMSGLA
jgi:leader peptidase (prepilin peptidase) / N-methyltransferase